MTENARVPAARKSEYVVKQVLACLLGVTVMSTVSHGATVSREPGGTLQDGTLIEAVTLSSKSGVSARILTYGATLQSLKSPDRNGKIEEITLGFDDVASYEKYQSYLGVTVGRYANRIAKGRFVLDGTTYQLPTNNGGNSLHGGGNGFDRLNWSIKAISSGARASVVLALSSPDGAMGYPGRVEATVTYALQDDGALSILFEAKSDKPTVINMTNHALFNLSGHSSTTDACHQRLTIAASRFLPVDDTLIPTGEFATVVNTPFDFRNPRTISDGLRDGRDRQVAIGRGYDHNFVLDKGTTNTPAFAARLADPQSGRVLDVFTTEPGIQFYSGNFLDGTVPGRGGKLYRMGDGIALEPQKFPDTPNRPEFGSARLDPGKTYRHEMVFKLSTSDRP